MRTFYLIVLALLLGCAKRMEIAPKQLVVSAFSSEFGASPDSKASETAFLAGDKIGVFLDNGGGDNLRYETSDGNSWIGFGNVKEIEEGREYHATAYYPYKMDAKDGSRIEHRVSNNQYEDMAMEMSDFMTCKSTAVSVNGNSASVKLNFTHAMSKLQVVINVPSEVAGATIKSLDSVVVRNAYNQCIVDLTAANTVGSLSDAGNVYARLTNNCDSATTVSIWEAVVIPQAVARVEFVFKTTGGSFVRQAYTQVLTLTGGVKTTLSAVSDADLYFASILDLKYGDEYTNLPLSIFVAKGRAWKLTCSEPWLKAEPASGVGTGEIVDVKVSVKANNSSPYAIRTAKLTLEDNKTQAIYTVMQNYSKFAPSTTDLVFNSASQQWQSIGEFASNRVYTVSATNTSGAGWLKLATSSVIGQGILTAPLEIIGALGKDKLFIQVVASNETAAARTEKVQFKIGTQVVKEFSVTQMPIPATVTVAGIEWTTANLSGQAGQAISAGVALDPSAYGNFFKWGSKYTYGRENGNTPEGHWGSSEADYNRGSATQPTAKSRGYDYASASGIMNIGGPVGDPCKLLGANYRTPTQTQLAELVAAGKSAFTTYKSTKGYLFGEKATSYNGTTIPDGCIFLPAAGYRDCLNGKLEAQGSSIRYWSSSVCHAAAGWALYALSNNTIYTEDMPWRGGGLAVRCVKVPPPPTVTTVTIAGTKWVTANLTGTVQGQTMDFTVEPTPQGLGMFWKWGSVFMYNRAGTNTPAGHWGSTEANYNIGSATQPTAESFDYDYANAGGIMNVGGPASDPCKSLGANYKTPTQMQLAALISTGNLNSSYQGVKGWFFGPTAASCNNTTLKPECIFLPMTGYRTCDGGGLNDMGNGGHYWTSSASGISYGWRLNFGANGVIHNKNDSWRGHGLAVRCVEKSTPPAITTVTIAGTKWTTANLTGDEQGQTSGFEVCASPSDYGMFWKWGSLYMYNRVSGNIPAGHWGATEAEYNRGSATSPTTPSRDYDYVNLASSWGAPVGDPCQSLGANYKTPTATQIKALHDAGKLNSSYKGTPGWFFGTNASSCTDGNLKADCIFLPMAGFRNAYLGGSINVGSQGIYWSSSVYDSTYGWNLTFGNDSSIYPENSSWRGSSFSIRCIAE